MKHKGFKQILLLISKFVKYALKVHTYMLNRKVFDF